MWKILGRTSSLLLKEVFFLEGGVLMGKKGANWMCSVLEPVLFEVKSVPIVSQKRDGSRAMQ